MSTRKQKMFKINLLGNNPGLAAFVAVFDNPNEVRIAADAYHFISVREDGITLSPGLSKNVNVQGLSHNLRYGGMVMDLPFPLSTLPITIATPLPTQVFAPPFMELLGTFKELSSLCLMLAG